MILLSEQGEEERSDRGEDRLITGTNTPAEEREEERARKERHTNTK
jgi:hypothetical protein